MSDITNVMKTIAADIDEKSESNAGQAAIVVEAKGNIVRVRFSGEDEAGETWFTSTINPVPVGCVGVVVSIRGNAGYFQPIGLNHDERYYTEAEVASLISEWQTRHASVASNTVISTSNVSADQSTFPVLYAFPVNGIFSDISDGVWDVSVTLRALVYRSVATGGVYISVSERDTGGGPVALGRNFPQTGGYTLSAARVLRDLTPSSIIDLKYSGWSTTGTTYCVSYDATFIATRVG